MKVVCIVQARVGSTRLPGKVLKKICGKTVLEHDIDRLRRIKNINEIVIATTILEKDNAIVEECERLGVKYFRGSEEDVLSRYYYTAKENNADVVVRVTSDCPLIDTEITNNTIKYFVDNNDKFDYVSNTGIERSFPRGLDTEVFSFSSLKMAYENAVDKGQREHVTQYIIKRPNEFKQYTYINNVNYSNHRWTLDTKEDLKLIEKIYEYLYPMMGNKFNMKDVLKLIQEHPEINKINKIIKQKKA